MTGLSLSTITSRNVKGRRRGLRTGTSLTSAATSANAGIGATSPVSAEGGGACPAAGQAAETSRSSHGITLLSSQGLKLALGNSRTASAEGAGPIASRRRLPAVAFSLSPDKTTPVAEVLRPRLAKKGRLAVWSASEVALRAGFGICPRLAALVT